MGRKLKLNYGEAVISLPAAVIGEAMERAGKRDFRVFLMICSDDRLRADLDAGISLAAMKCGCSAEEFEQSVAFWRGCGLLDCGEEEREVKAEAETKDAILSSAATERMPSYTGLELDTIVRENPAIVEVLNEAQRILGYMFKTGELNDIVAMSEYLGLTGEYILCAVRYGHERGIKKLSAIKSMVLRFMQEGITTEAALKEHIALLEKRYSFEGRLRKLFGLGERKLTAKEAQIAASWADDGISEELLTKAYEITVNNTGKPSMPYTAKIIASWKERGVKTVADIDALPKKQDSKGSSFDTDEFFELALKRSYEKLGDNK